MTGVPIMLRLLCLLVWLASWTANAIDIQRLLLQQQKQLDELEDKLEDALETFERQDNVPDFTNLLVSTLSATLGEQYGVTLQPASHIFHNGDIITVSPDSNWDVEAVAVHDGKILAVGKKADVMRHVTADTIMMDLKGDTLLPGLIEPHTHPIFAAWFYGVGTDIGGYEGLTKEGAWDRIREAIARTPEKQWVIITGFNPMLVQGMTIPTIAELNRLAPDHKLFIQSQSAHVGYLNQNGLDAAGVTKDTVVPAGEFTKDSLGELTGIAYELGAIRFIWSHIPRIEDRSQVEKLLKRQLNSYSQHGYTTIAGAGLIHQSMANSTAILKALTMEASCPIRAIVYRGSTDMDSLPELQNAEPCRPSPDNFCLIGVKWWADGTPYAGAIGFKTPFMESNWTRALNFPPAPNYGALLNEHNDMHRSFLEYHKRGFQLAVHTQGPRAVEQVLDVYSSILQSHPRKDHRYRLEHNAFIEDDQLVRAKQMGVTVSFYADHVRFFGNALKEGIVGKIAERVMPFRSALDAGLEQTVHTDTPCTPLGPMRLFKTMATRAMWRGVTNTPPGEPEQILGPDQAIPIDEVIKAFTINSAKQIFHENYIGSIEVGKMADFTRLSANPRKVDPFNLDTIDIVTTYQSGEQAQGFVVED